jgi:chemotaxis-related protein WspB
MLLILFKIGRERYALAGRHIVEIVPYLIPKKLAAQPKFVPGVINYRGVEVPIIDLGAMLAKAPCRTLLSTRIILINYTGKTAKSCPRVIGLLAEEVNESLQVTVDALHLVQAGAESGSGKQYINADLVGQKMLQLFEPNKFLPDSVLENLAS